jgi:hypothetical protein
MLTDSLLKFGLTAILMYVPAIAGLVIGIIALVQMRKYQPEKLVNNPNMPPLPGETGVLPMKNTWLNNGFISGLFLGFVIGVGFIAFYVISMISAVIIPNFTGITTTTQCICLIAGIGLAVLLGILTYKKIIKSGLDGVGPAGKGAGRLLLAILGILIGFWTGFVCMSLLLVPFILIKTAQMI